METLEVRVLRVEDPPPFPEINNDNLLLCNASRAVVLQKATTGGNSAVTVIGEAGGENGEVLYIAIQLTTKTLNFLMSITRGACASWGENVGE
jgi:hypothetical protein